MEDTVDAYGETLFAGNELEDANIQFWQLKDANAQSSLLCCEEEMIIFGFPW